MSRKYIATELIITLEVMPNGHDGELPDMRVAAHVPGGGVAIPIERAIQMSRTISDRSFVVISWSMDGGTHVEAVAEDGELCHYAPYTYRAHGQRWNYAILDTVAQHLDTICRSQIPVPPPPDEPDPFADTADMLARDDKPVEYRPDGRPIWTGPNLA